MTDIEISRALALAIGWSESDIDASDSAVFVCYEVATLAQPATWRIFDYRTPSVIWPIAKATNNFPSMVAGGLWCSGWSGPSAETPEKAVALAVIGGHAAK